MDNRKIDESMSFQYFHNKVLMLNVFLTFVIVMLHSIPLGRIGINTNDEYPFVHAVSIFSQVGVPMFFFMSAILLYKNLNSECLGEKLKRRLRSLAIPWVLWNLLFVAVFWTMTHISAISSMMNMEPVPSDAKGLFFSVINSKYTVLWFVRNLFIYSCLAPVLLIILRNKIVGIFVLVVLVVLNICVDFGYEHIVHWMPVYLLGGFIGYHGLYQITPPERR